MMRRMVVKNAANLTPSERRVCYGMSYGHDGDLAPWLNESRDSDRVGDKVVLVREGDLVVGWAYRRKEGNVGFWVRRGYRQQGIGTAMVERTKKMGKVKTHPHSVPSAKLFRKTKTLPQGKVREWQRIIKMREGQ